MRIRIVVQDGTTYEGELVGSDARTDLAVVRIEADELTPIDLGQTDTLSIGDIAIAVGNPLGLLRASMVLGNDQFPEFADIVRGELGLP